MKRNAAAWLWAALAIAGCAGAPPHGTVQGGPPDQPGEEIVTVEAEGEANVIPGNKLSTRDQSLMAAQKAAVEKAVGVLVTGQMVVSQARLIEDQVFSKTGGYLKAWDVLSEKENDGVYTTRIRARVKLGDVRKDLDALGMLIKTKKVGNPRVMVLIDEKVDGKPSESKTVEIGLAKALLEKGYKVVDADQLAEIRSQENTLKALNGDLTASADLAKRFGADIALVGAVNARQLGAAKAADGSEGNAADNPMGDMLSYRGRLSLKAVKSSSGQVVLADSREGAGMDITQEGASIRCLSSLAEAAGAEMAEKLAPALWEGADVELALANVKDFSTLQSVMAALRAVDGVRNVVNRSFAGTNAVFDVELAGGNAQTLAAQLEGRVKPSMEIKETAAYRIEAALKPEGTTP